ncbi:MAG: NAD(P)/FAD-dependent oxidoreductase [Candidatus Heimdallarchaeota archaeon]|nr:NAD(P)/FAD-dependent oxidoreductase [Candidatus Heimdallarchaeota archaeon]MCK4876210.1 NAD(P)/FAD-dependent oxidoreductase [Candidatus Heimdallarchaeota archaeon]
MEPEVTDIAVVGGGPAGLFAAKSAAERGSDVLLFESKDKIGFHEHCAGLLSVDGLESLELTNLPSDVIQNSNIIGARIYSPSGNLVTVSKGSTTAYVVDRVRFNQYLSSLAIEKGVEIKTSTSILNIKRNGNGVELQTGKKTSSVKTQAKIAIFAEGRFPKLNTQVKLPVPPREKVIFASMYVMSNINDIDPKFVELYQTQKFAPNFFAWIIPIDEESAKIGIGSQYSPSGKYLEKFVLKHPIAKEKLKQAKIEKKTSGAIPLSSYIKRTYTDNVLVVGDAAGQIKPTTGGGVILGGVASRFAGEVAADSITANDQSAKYLSRYEKLWKKEMKTNLFVMKHVRQYLNTLTDKETERLFLLINKPKIKDIVSQIGDVDNQKKVVFRLLLKYNLWPFFIRTGTKYLLKK